MSVRFFCIRLFFAYALEIALKIVSDFFSFCLDHFLVIKLLHKSKFFCFLLSNSKRAHTTCAFNEKMVFFRFPKRTSAFYSNQLLRCCRLVLLLAARSVFFSFKSFFGPCLPLFVELLAFLLIVESSRFSFRFFLSFFLNSVFSFWTQMSRPIMTVFIILHYCFFLFRHQVKERF